MSGKYPNYSLSVVIPAYNEEEVIRGMVEHVLSAVGNLGLMDYEVIVVNDGSKDRTPEIVEGMAKTEVRLKVIDYGVNKGYADALKTGFLAAKFPLVFYTDADRQFDVNEIGLLMDHADDYDIVCGYRAPRVDPFQRIFIAGVYNRINNMIFGLGLKDVDCAFKLFRKDVFDKVSIDSKGFLVDLEIMAKAKKLGLRIKEVPVTHYKRAGGVSKVTSGAVFETIRGIVWLRGVLRR